METAWTRNVNGRLEVKFPWKIDPTNLANNRDQALSRSIRLENKLSKNEQLSTLFKEQMEEMIELGIIVKVNPDEAKRYIPLHTVINLERESSKLRVCMDSKSSYRGTSLNDALLKGRHEFIDLYHGVLYYRPSQRACDFLYLDMGSI